MKLFTRTKDLKKIRAEHFQEGALECLFLSNIVQYKSGDMREY